MAFYKKRPFLQFTIVQLLCLLLTDTVISTNNDISIIMGSSPKIDQDFKNLSANACQKLLSSMASTKCVVKLIWDEVNNVYNSICEGKKPDNKIESDSSKNLAESVSCNCNTFKIVKKKMPIAKPIIPINMHKRVPKAYNLATRQKQHYKDRLRVPQINKSKTTKKKTNTTNKTVLISYNTIGFTNKDH